MRGSRDFVVALAVGTCAVGALAGCDPFESSLTVTSSCADEQVIAVGEGYDPRRSEEELVGAAVALGPDATYSVDSLEPGAEFYIVLAVRTPQERLEVVTAERGERDAFYTIAGADCAPAGASTLVPDAPISRVPAADA